MRSVIENLYNTLHVVNVINIIEKYRHWSILLCKEALLIDIKLHLTMRPKRLKNDLFNYFLTNVALTNF